MVIERPSDQTKLDLRQPNDFVSSGISSMQYFKKDNSSVLDFTITQVSVEIFSWIGPLSDTPLSEIVMTSGSQQVSFLVHSWQMLPSALRHIFIDCSLLSNRMCTPRGTVLFQIQILFSPSQGHGSDIVNSAISTVVVWVHCFATTRLSGVGVFQEIFVG